MKENRTQPPDGHQDDRSGGWNRRDFLGVSIGGLPVVGLATAGVKTARPVGTGAPAGALPVTLHVNGRARRLSLDPRSSLLDALRDDLALTGTKMGCDHGQCGACTRSSGGARSASRPFRGKCRSP